jgi:A/G-specific adenine glycosylase
VVRGGVIPAAGRRRLLVWSDETRRDLPWRRTRDPWAVMVSELMLQQTQVARVIPKYEAFLDRFPDPATCAAAPVGDVVTAWAGLGYNRRAVNLHRCARMVTDELGGALPDDLDGLLALPGIGPYTARAVLAFAHERDVGVLDTNAARVLARVGGASLAAKGAQEAADASVPAGEGWRWNEAMLDLGATVCRARSAACDACPIAAWCAWSLAGCPEPDPAVGSAGVSTPQSTFEGSHRQGRGRLVDALRERGAVDEPDLAAAAGWPDDAVRARAAADSLVADGIATWSGDALTWA